MESIRQGLFETNSSSTHAIAVTLNKDTEFEPSDLYGSWSSYKFCYGREVYRLVDSWDEKLAYVYIVLLDIVNSKNVVYPEVDLKKFRSSVSKVYNEVLDEVRKKNNLEFEFLKNNATPDQIIQVLDFTYAKGQGLIPEGTDPGFDFNTYKFRSILNDNFGPYIDHTEYFCVWSKDDRRFTDPCVKFIEKILSDEVYLKYFLFSDDSYITIGGDEYMGYNLKTLGFEYDYRDKDEWERRVDEYKKTHEVYFKGN